MIYNSKKAFTLIELSISLLIIGIIISITGNIGRVSVVVSKYNETEAKMDFIYVALQQYLVKHKRLPCPAGLKLKNTHSDFGKEIRENNGSDENCITGENYGIFEDEGEYFLYGTIPVDSLNINRGYMFDGFGNRIAYIVKKNATLESDLNDLPVLPAEGNFNEYITIKLNKNTSIEENIFLLLSHGANGAKSFNKFGEQNNDSVNEEEKDNIINTTEKFDNQFTDINSDDRLSIYANKFQLANITGLKYQPCTKKQYEGLLTEDLNWGASIKCDNSLEIRHQCSDYSILITTNNCPQP